MQLVVMEILALMIWFQFFRLVKAKHVKISSINDKKLKDFDQSLNKVLLNLAKRVVADGEGSSKFITINVNDAKTDLMQKKLLFQ